MTTTPIDSKKQIWNPQTRVHNDFYGKMEKMNKKSLQIGRQKFSENKAVSNLFKGSNNRIGRVPRKLSILILLVNCWKNEFVP